MGIIILSPSLKSPSSELWTMYGTKSGNKSSLMMFLRPLQACYIALALKFVFQATNVL